MISMSCKDECMKMMEGMKTGDMKDSMSKMMKGCMEPADEVKEK